MKYNADISIVFIKKKNQKKTLIKVCGNITRYAPVTAAIAPLAPRTGVLLKMQWPIPLKTAPAK